MPEDWFVAPPPNKLVVFVVALLVKLPTPTKKNNHTCITCAKVILHWH